MKKIGILGGGFGIYGYMPCFLQINYEVYTLNKYQSFINSRKELSQYQNSINFVSTEKKLLNNVDYLVIARDPISQRKLIQSLTKKYTHIFLEKPLAEENNFQENTLNYLEKEKQSFSIFYTFHYLNWYKDLKNIIYSYDSFNISIDWYIFKSKNNFNSWKYNKILGGGIGRYYGIHFFDLIDNYDNFIFSVHNSIDEFYLIIKDPSEEKKLSIRIKLSKKNSFTIKNDNLVILDTEDPIGIVQPNEEDPRVKIIKDYVLDTPRSAHNLEAKVLTWLKLTESS